ncbi:sugar transferase [Microbacterium betulae]|uniref:Sugar transferase n=1 Tax=Microbacterium betulae TaxID=2981139 RepID=A0AA97FGM6_9MICO|nr:sugar transferase [Microbacterium sp. AB]WOF22630.1 sugar transferase [Microbacterium sp. AB]
MTTVGGALSPARLLAVIAPPAHAPADDAAERLPPAGASTDGEAPGPDAPPALTAVLSPRSAAPVLRRRRLERRAALRVTLTDAALVAAASAAAALSGPLPEPAAAVVALTAASLWWVGLALAGGGAPHRGAAPYGRATVATAAAFGVLAILLAPFDTALLQAQLVAAPAGLAAVLAGRALWHRRLVSERRTGAAAPRALVIGLPDDVDRVSSALNDHGRSGYLVVGTLPLEKGADAAMGRIADAMARLGADAVVIASAHTADAGFVQRLRRQLAGAATEIALASGMADSPGPRLSLHQAAGLPLVRMRVPAYDGGAHLAKRALDIVVAVLALVPVALLAPVIALAIVVDSPGPVLFRQERVGRDGRRFRMIKFRSMAAGAEDELALLSPRNEASGPLFKLRDDPRVTRVGRILRRTSLDELPQFWNVLVGDMSVVGPRPPLPREVLAYDRSAVRRLYVKPGITGPWQVGGRSDLSWEQSMRLDLHYVENWSILSDLVLIWRTVMVMVRAKGAY